MRSPWPLIALLTLGVAGCGGGEDPRRGKLQDGETGGWTTLVRELVVASDYGQLYIYDPHRPPSDEPMTEDDNELIRSLGDAYESRRFVGFDNGLINVVTPSQYNWSAPLRLEVGSGPPPLDEAGWDHIVEGPLSAPSGTLFFEASGGGEQIETSVPPSIYRARIAGRNFRAGIGLIEGEERYRLQLWPAPAAEPTLLKYWHGYDEMRPAE
jgi:hypothetical protein